MADEYLSIFPVSSPIDRSFGSTELKAPKPMSDEIFDTKYKKMLKKVRPLLEVKEEADKVYSNGYFENHYPEADKKLKSLLHEKAMDAWARSLSSKDAKVEDEEEEEKAEKKAISITISLGL